MEIRPALFAAALAALSAAPALAGDAAQLEILGFSKDGGVFAFEEYGVQDGSGFPYANRYYIDTTSDTFVKGTPVKVRLDDESASLADARKEARAKGEAIVREDELAANRGFTAGWNAVTEYTADPHRISVNPRPVFPPIDPALEFRLEEVRLENPARCADQGDTVGFQLLRVATGDGGRTQLVHEDRAIPESRRCPLGYRIGGVQTFHPQGGAPVFAVMIAVRQVGFEGPDHRWLAVTEYSADPHRMSVNPRPVFPPIDPALEFRLEEVRLENPSRCADLGDVVGLRLLKVATEDGGTTRLLHEDTTVPQSRGCPLGYRIGGVQTFHPEGGSPVFAVMVAVRQIGFEGPDHRWMAVTGQIAD